ncbi:MAG: citrate synthase [Myxococcota bacterium]
MGDTATLTLDNGKSLDIDVITGSEGEKGLVLGKFRKETGYITVDPGFVNTGACQSDITFINGEEGVLRYRGYPITEIAENSSFLETCYLMTEGRLPTKSEFDEFEESLTKHSLLHEQLKPMFRAFPPDAHPMAILSAVVQALSTFYQNEKDPLDPDQIRLDSIRLMAKLPTIAAFSYKQSLGQPYIYPNNARGYAARLLEMMFAFPTEPYEVDAEVAKVLDLLLILHADHEQNCSTTTVRTVGSARANLYASISAGISALWGPLHGGANQRVLEMLEQIRQDGGDVDKYVKLAKDKDSGFRLMGFGHRVYKNYDPRAYILRDKAASVLDKMQKKDELLDIARKLEEHALKDSYFVDKKLYPNVDFYSGIIYRAMGIPTNMFTVMFSLGRLPGWIAQWKEGLTQGLPISRPRQIYTGPTERPYVPIDKRG